MQVKAKKALGQHFLTDESIAKRISESLQGFNLPIVEVGGGMGVLTQFLVEDYPDLRVVELDTESVTYLKAHFPSSLEGKIIAGDFLKLDLGSVFEPQGSPFLLIGNFPYNISTQIFFHLLEYRDLVPAASGMLQKEVSERLAAPAGTRASGILSVFLQAWYDIEYLFSVPPEVFSPPPKVNSGVIRLVRNDRKTLGVDEQLFKTVVKTAFNQRRKTLRNALKPLLGDRKLPSEAFLTRRAEQLTVDDFINLTEEIQETISKDQSL